MKKIAIVVSQFNEEVTSKLLTGAYNRLLELNISKQNIKVIHVPGAVEIPYAAQLLAKTKQFEAIIALGAVIRGETSHYDYVCDQVSQGCQRVMLDHHIPVIFGVLTTDTEEQALARVGGDAGHKGKDAADTAIAMLKLKVDISLEFCKSE